MVASLAWGESSKKILLSPMSGHMPFFFLFYSLFKFFFSYSFKTKWDLSGHIDKPCVLYIRRVWRPKRWSNLPRVATVTDSLWWHIIQCMCMPSHGRRRRVAFLKLLLCARYHAFKKCYISALNLLNSHWICINHSIL